MTPTGGFYQVTQDSNRMVRRQILMFTLALAAILLSIHVLFRSLRYTVIALIPALVPMLLIGGIMGYSGIDLNVGTAMIAPVVLGLVVDNTIHYLARYRGIPRGRPRGGYAHDDRSRQGAARILAHPGLRFRGRRLRELQADRALFPPCGEPCWRRRPASSWSCLRASCCRIGRKEGQRDEGRRTGPCGSVRFRLGCGRESDNCLRASPGRQEG